MRIRRLFLLSEFLQELVWHDQPVFLLSVIKKESVEEFFRERLWYIQVKRGINDVELQNNELKMDE